MSNLYQSIFFFPAWSLEDCKMGVMRGQPSAVGAHCSLAVHLGSCRQYKKNTSSHTHTYTLTWSGRFTSRAENVIPLHWDIQLNKLNCVAFLDYSSICSMLELSTSNQQYIFFESCMGFRFQGASVCLLVLIIHYRTGILWVYYLGVSCRRTLFVGSTQLYIT